MTIRLAAVAASTSLAASALLGALPAGAQEGPLPLTVDPPSGTDAVFTVSGTDCVQDGTPGFVEIFIDGEFVPGDTDVADDDGSWAFEISPEGAAPDPGVLEITATCTDDSGATIVEYAAATYEVVAASAPQPTPEAPAPEAPAPAAPAPARPVVAQPTFTG
jgi:pyruvate dehydrogenase E2 component (dihydrolipoamide acetyltransferase)